MPTNASEKIYSKPSEQQLRTLLTPEQYHCTQEEGTERPFTNAYWDHHADGIYVDVVSGQPLFSSLDKFDSGTGWPSFTKSIAENAVRSRPDHKLGVPRTEVRSFGADSHLGHLFHDGPGPTRQRYCINSAALRFIPLGELKEKGYGQYLFLFAQKQHWQITTLAGGCFWGMEHLFQEIPGVIETQVGYAGGASSKVTYEEIRKGTTGHAETIQILFNPAQLSYEQILLRFFKIHDPTTLNRQGNDVGSQYRSAIFYQGAEQKKIAETIKARIEKSGAWKRPIVTQIVPFTTFVHAESNHQKYLSKHPNGYTCHFVRKLQF